MITPSSGHPVCSTLKVIDNTCLVIQQTQHLDSRLGFSLDSSGKLRGVYPVQREDKGTRLIGKPVQLEELLTNPPFVNGVCGLTLKEKYVISLLLFFMLWREHFGLLQGAYYLSRPCGISLFIAE